MRERTLSIVKPDGISMDLIGEVISRFERGGMKVVALKMLHLTKEQARGFYAVHREKPFFESLTDFMASGPAVAMVLEGEDAIQRTRQIMGATNPQHADQGTIRREFASSVERNIVHGSDGTETAAVEIAYFFNAMEIHAR
jgi:nucleoside-diphosphate kinase